jgi:hypothetical protein
VNAVATTEATKRVLTLADYRRHLSLYLLTNLCLDTDLSRGFERGRIPEPLGARGSNSA